MNISFAANENALIWILSSLLILFSILLHFEITRKNRSFLPGRLLAIVFITLSLAGLSLQPSIVRKTNTRPALLITKGSTEKLIDSLKQVYLPIKLLDLRKNSIINNPVRLQKVLKTHDTWIICGRGLDARARDYLKDKQVTYFPKGFQTGFQQVDFNTKSMNNSLWQVNGNFYNRSEGKLKLYLEASGQKRDSMEISAPGFHDFSLATQLKESPGRYLFNIKAFTEEEQLL
ncbi:MAG: hypothetical protein AAGI07_14275, partial [Bacteroidota bacterium]